MFSLTRTKPSDGAGDSGSMCMKLRVDMGAGTVEELPCDYPEVGWMIKVGTPHARTFGWQDWWRTSPIAKILEETEDEESVLVVFETENSTYEWRKYK